MRALFSWLATSVMSMFCVHAAFAQEPAALISGDLLTPTTTELTPAGAFKKAPPWRIGVSFSRMTNSWIVQTVKEMHLEAERNPNISEFIFVEADGKPAKQIADIEDLLARKVDALLVLPISEAAAKPLIEKAANRGIPVITFGAFASLPSTVQIGAAGTPFGTVGGKFLCEEMKGKGNVWAFRGPAGSDEERLRYEGFKKEADACGLKVSAEVHGDYNYAKSKQLCENLVLSGRPVDGIWFAGAEMTRACLDVFKETGRKLVPVTGEGNNGFLRIWKETGVSAVAPIFSPEISSTWVRAAVELLEGRQLYKTYFSAPPPITNANIDDYYRSDLSDAYWVPSGLPEETLKEMFAR